MRNIINYKTALAGALALALAVGLATFLPRENAAPQVALTAPIPVLEIPVKKPVVEPEAKMDGLLYVAIAAAPESQRAALGQIYHATESKPVWVAGKSGAKRAKALWQAQLTASDHGIDADALGDLLPQIDTTKQPEAKASLDVAITIEALRLAGALRNGAVPVQGLGESWLMRQEIVDPVSGLVEAIEKGEVASFFASLPPQTDQYKVLVSALGFYRDIAARGGWPSVQSEGDVGARLAAEGYLQASETSDAAKVDDATRTFQTRNGLEPDGKVGKRTLAALNVTVDERIGQIAANLERWRHTPRDLGRDYVAANTASTFVEVIRDGKVDLRLRAITGTPGHATPIISATVTAVTFNPRWNIPPSIASKEILAKLQKDPNYLAKNNMVMVGADADDPSGQRHDWHQYSPKSFPVKLRQAPGDDNALGRIKLEMPNPYNIYMHDTPSRALFAKDDRHLSHGCVRVDQPEELARHVLADPSWEAEAINAAVDSGATRTVRLKTPLPVYVFYWTVFAEDGALQFRPDAYRRDAPLAKKLGIDPARNPRLLASEG